MAENKSSFLGPRFLWTTEYFRDRKLPELLDAWHLFADLVRGWIAWESVGVNDKDDEEERLAMARAVGAVLNLIPSLAVHAERLGLDSSALFVASASPRLWRGFEPDFTALNDVDVLVFRMEARCGIVGPGLDVRDDQSPDPPRHSADFHSVNCLGRIFTFTPTQAACVKALWEAWEQGTPEVGQQTILENATGYKLGRLRDVFRNHPAWETLIIKGKKGNYRLNLPRD